MDKIIGTNLGNWLVLEKWMQPFIFQGTGAEDETWLNRNVSKEKLWPMMKQHRDTYVTEDDFRNIASHGLNTVRIPVPYFIFGDREPYSGCIEYLDKAFEWAEKYGLEVLVDLHTAPGCQNSYDNGGLMGVCKWSQMPDEVEFVLTVLERLAERYKDREGLFGIEVLNEPISFSVYMTATSRKMAADKDEAKGSHHVSEKVLCGCLQEIAPDFAGRESNRISRWLPPWCMERLLCKAAYEKRNAGYSYLYSGNGGCDAHPQILGISGIYRISASSVEKSTEIYTSFRRGMVCVQ